MLQASLWLLLLASLVVLALALALVGRRRNEDWKGPYSRTATVVFIGTVLAAVLVVPSWHLDMPVAFNTSLYIPLSGFLIGLLNMDRRRRLATVGIMILLTATGLFFFAEQPVKVDSSRFWWSASAPGPYLTAAALLALFAAARLLRSLRSR